MLGEDKKRGLHACSVCGGLDIAQDAAGRNPFERVNGQVFVDTGTCFLKRDSGHVLFAKRQLSGCVMHRLKEREKSCYARFSF